MRTFLFIFTVTLCFLASYDRIDAAPAFTPLALFTEDGFKVPQPDNTFSFPKDHGRHPEFKVEWWYFTGHLWGPKNERYSGSENPTSVFWPCCSTGRLTSVGSANINSAALS